MSAERMVKRGRNRPRAARWSRSGLHGCSVPSATSFGWSANRIVVGTVELGVASAVHPYSFPEGYPHFHQPSPGWIKPLLAPPAGLSW